MKKHGSSHIAAKLVASGALGGFLYLLTQSISGMLLVSVTVYCTMLYLMRFVPKIGPTQNLNQYAVAGGFTVALVGLSISNQFAALLAMGFGILVFSVLVLGDAAATIFSKYVEKAIAQSKAKKPPTTP